MNDSDVGSLLVWALDTLSDSHRELHIPVHDGDTLGVLGTELRIDEEFDEVVFRGLLERLDSETLKTDIGFVVVLHNLTNELGER